MKRIISIMIVSLLLLPVFCLTGTAAGEIPVSVKADIQIKTTTDTVYQDNLSGSVTVLPKINAQATLDMTNVRNIVELIAAGKISQYQTLKTNGYVKAAIIVNIKYPDTLTIDETLPQFKYIDETNTEAFIYNRDSVTTPASDTGFKAIKYELSTDEIKVSDLVDTETPNADGSLSVTANKKLDDIIMSSQAVEIQIPAFDTEYKIFGDITCIAEIYTKASPTDTAKIPFRTYKFTGNDTATVKYTKYSPSTGGGSGSISNKITISSTVPSGEIPAGTKVGLKASVHGAKIYYTTDGTDPQIDENGNLIGSTKLYSDEITITDDTTLKGIAVAASGKVKSEIGKWDYAVKGIDISIIPSSGLIKPGTSITIDTNKGERIYYTTDGTDPQIDENGNPVGTTKEYTDEFLIYSETTVKAIAVGENGEVSVIATEIYTLSPELTGEHIAYIQGYPDYEFKPEKPITRGEVAEIFARLTVKKINVETDLKTTFTDVPENSWYHNSIAFMEKSGIINGYADGTFRPDNYITRAEFATMASRFDMLADVNENIFSDVTSLHWAFFNINSAYKKGWINGYPGDTNFYPSHPIKRCEAVTIVNRMTGRHAEQEFKDADLSGYIIFDDTNTPDSHWAFYEVVESSNTHDYN